MSYVGQPGQPPFENGWSNAWSELQPQPDALREPLPLFMGSEPIVARRLWRISWLGKVRLWSLAKGGMWPSRCELHARCIRAHNHDGPAPPSHRAPWPDGRCECGIWAFRSDEPLYRTLWMYAGSARPHHDAWAIGDVKLWGRVVELEHGYRGEYAYPGDLQLIDTAWVSNTYVAALAADLQDMPPAALCSVYEPDLPLLGDLAARVSAEYGVQAAPLDLTPPPPGSPRNIALGLPPAPVVVQTVPSVNVLPPGSS